LLLASCFFL
jgi:hypothetical protein